MHIGSFRYVFIQVRALECDRWNVIIGLGTWRRTGDKSFIIWTIDDSVDR